MSDRKLSSVEVKSEIVARDMQAFLQERYDEGEYPLPVMLGLAELRYLSLRIARVEKDLATERRLHRETEKRAATMKVGRDVARKERDELIREPVVETMSTEQWVMTYATGILDERPIP